MVSPRSGPPGGAPDKRVDARTRERIILGRIVPVEPAGARAEALAIREGRIVAVGSRAEAEAALPGAPVLDLGERAILPGFGDSHVHLVLTGLGMLGAQLGACTSVGDVLAALADFSAMTLPGTPLWAHGLSPARLAERRAPTRQELDRLAPDRPVFLVDRGHHACTVNSAALAALAARDPSIRDARGDGLLVGTVNTAAKQAFSGLVNPSLRRAAIHAAAREAAAVGVTHVHAMDGGWSGPDDPLLIAEEAPRLPIRVTVYEQVMDVQRVRAGGAERIGGDIWLDGGLYQRTAAFFEPYADDPSTHGTLYQQDAELFAFVEEAHRAGVQVAVHAIGDRAIEQALRAYEAAQASVPRPDARHRIEHFTYATEEQHRRAATLGLALSIQPNVPYDWRADEALTIGYLGAERASRKSHVRRALDAGTLVAGGSDSDVRPIQPLWALQLLLTDERPGRRLTLDEALTIFTLNVARAAFLEGECGSLMPGKRADLVVLARDPAEVEASDLKDLGVVATFLDGRVVSGLLPGA